MLLQNKLSVQRGPRNVSEGVAACIILMAGTAGQHGAGVRLLFCAGRCLLTSHSRQLSCMQLCPWIARTSDAPQTSQTAGA
jgi:hypothetical protein